MAQPLSYEDPSEVVLITTKTLCGRLWFIDNPKLWAMVVSYLAKYAELYGVVLYGFIIMGNHYHLIARFPKANRAKFMRAFNAMFAKLVAEYVPGFPGGKVWARRYAWQVLPLSQDILHKFLYIALNPVSSGLDRSPYNYKTYNSFHDALRGIETQYQVFDRMAYNERKRFDPHVKKEDFISTHTLKYEKLPGYENLSQAEYTNTISKLHKSYLNDAIKKRESEGLGFAGPKILKKIKPGDIPKTTKHSKRFSFRPIVLTLCKETKRQFLQKYFELLLAFKEASKKFLAGQLNVLFPQGTYPPCKVAVA